MIAFCFEICLCGQRQNRLWLRLRDTRRIFERLKTLTGHVHTEVCTIFVLFTSKLLTRWISSLMNGFTICPCAERQSTKSDRDKYFPWTGDVNRSPARRCLRAWKASDVIAICKMILGKFQYLEVKWSKSRLSFSLPTKLSRIHSAKPFAVWIFSRSRCSHCAS